MNKVMLTRTQGLIQRAITEGGVVLVLLGWWLFSKDMPAFIMPTPQAAFGKMLEFFYDPALMRHAAISFMRVGLAVILATVLALIIGLLTRAFPILEEAVERRLLTFFNSFPSVGWAILAVIWFRISDGTVIFIQVMIILPFCLINVLEGLRQLDPELVEMGRSLTRSRRRLFLRLVLPLTMPFLIAGLRVAYGIAWKVALVSELFGAPSGLGYLLMQAQVRADATLVFACCLVIVLIFGVMDHFVLRPLARRYSVQRAA
ncbi:NitT/TauT family transport system permease protein/sulfonate transport system permease protein [Gemmobacter megaterium]|uniref:NitT/TauT family transport system permease protein/sulfonate transport system permease protein n=2 Tax=Gemmobacter megaterium TaxID=1086013 RepID=A0A1N7Q657_9RHOB|nr:NitT/TauT family transport system permease protein/sulfonate transport system permease protein [Gemmobacter megaterium]